jgi:anti-sigma-K factor RskA
MSDPSSAVKNLRERLAGAGEDHLGKALSDLLENPLLTGTIGRAFDARERAVQAQELAMGALNIPSAADIERLTRRLRSVSQRLEGIEDGVHRLDRALAARTGVESRLSKIEEQLGTIARKLSGGAGATGATPARSAAKATAKKAAKKAPAKKAASAKPAKPAKPASAKRSTTAKPPARRTAAKPKKA